MASGRRSALRPDFGTALQARGSLVDASLLASVPVFLLAVFSLPAATREVYVLESSAPTLVTMYASHFVHQSGTHLAANLAGYAVVVPTAYLCCLLAGRRRLFRVSFLALLIALPFGLSALNLVVLRSGVAYGFSGIVMGFFGLLALSLYVYVADQVDPSARNAPGAFFLGIAIICVALPPAIRASVGIAAVALGGSLLYGHQVTGVVSPNDRLWSSVVDPPPGYLELGAVGALVFVGYPFIAFPADPLQGGTVVNLYAHLLGYALGFISTYTFLMVPGTTPIVEGHASG